MGASTKRKKEKQQDFKKPKLKVGKTKAKPENFTDTSFKSKSITLNQQSLTLNAPSTNTQFTHQLSLLSSKSDSQRRDALAYLTTAIASKPINTPLPHPVSLILPPLLPLILDASQGVRNNLLKLLRILPEHDIRDHVAQLMPYIRAGMTHLAADVRLSSIEILGWLLSVAGHEVVGAAGGWVKTLNCFLSVLGWHIQASNSKWTSAPASVSASASSSTSTSATASKSGGAKSSFGKAGVKGRPQVRFITILGEFLDAGIGSADDSSSSSLSSSQDGGDGGDAGFPVVNFKSQMIPVSVAAPYLYLNLFGAPRDEEGEMYETSEDRWRVFESRGFLGAVEKGIDGARSEGGEVGRASAGVRRVLVEAKAGF
ncbi:Rix1 complex component [Aspergillus varians]